MRCLAIGSSSQDSEDGASEIDPLSVYSISGCRVDCLDILPREVILATVDILSMNDGASVGNLETSMRQE